MNDIPHEPQPGLAAVNKAIDELENAIQLSRLQNDPLVHVVRAIQATLKSHLEIYAADAEALSNHRLNIDRDFNAIRQSRNDLSRMTDAIVKSAKAEVEAAHAETARQIVGSIARSAEYKLTAMSKLIWWRTIVLAATAMIGILLLGAGAGYWRGYQVGHYDAATTIRSATPIANAVLARRDGTAALHDWNNLMRDNPIVAVMDKCHGHNLAKQDGRTACHMWLWTTPYVPPTPQGSQ
jgi:hypothetical protein